MTETWLPVVGYVGLYEVSNRGQVKSLERTVLRSDGFKRRVSERTMSVRINGHSHGVGLWRDGTRRWHSVPQLINAAFGQP